MKIVRNPGVTTVPRLPTTTTTTTTPNIVSQRPTTPPPLPQRPRARTINIVPGFKEEELAMPPLPSMPVRSVSKGTASAISSMLSSRLHNNGHTTAATPTNTCQYPDMQHFDRLPPHIKTYPTHHRRTLRAIAACQGRLATASYTIKAWDDHRNNKNASITLTPSTDSTGNDRVSSLAYTCTGNYLFAGLDDGCTVVMDTQKAKILAELQHHEYAVKHILRVANTELWTIDEGGQLLRYPMHDYDDSMPETIMYDGYHHRVTPKAISAVVLRATQGQGQHHVLAMTTGDTIDAYRFVPFYSSAMPQIQVQLPYHVVRIPSDLGQITQLVALPQGKLACAHVNGRISVWDANNDTWEQTLQVAVPTYGITAMALSLDRFLWTGYRTGMIYIYDISSDEQWSLVKMWEAHHGPITMFTVDELGLLCDDKKPLMQVVSADQQGNVTVWDGLLAEYQRDQHMKQLEETYCDYRPTRIQISSWNIDALSPESITGQDKALLDEWLSSMRDADIIVVGLQEIVDLESKRQTAPKQA
ncbi:WD40-repeat-containing domain protein [Zychaea mexicana]|uniref:WD40-repeat-containing domain protein n=1 Tax=Zychaea mexicana TaxID=64656 RepID=UPI0022FE2BB7|nr:WD40-repeat-containing domain protein [Zychaea mexicana]KAI9496778.1 WD40-repeat-containing domain protein [Zychaea mexicana]